MDFGPSARRLIGRLAPERWGVLTVVSLGVISVVLSVLGPKILGQGTNVIFDGLLGRQLGAGLPAGTTKDQAVELLRSRGQNNVADMLAASNAVPGQGIDFSALGTVLMWVLVLYVASSVFMWLQAYLLNDIVQRTILRLRNEVEGKLNRLPLSYFDKQPRGEVLSRVTNDIDNISQSLQQTMSQILSSILTVIGVLIMMVVISPLLAVIAIVAVPLSIILTTQIAKRSQKKFIAQWRHTGELNGQIEEAFTGHSLVNVFNRRGEIERIFGEKNEELYQASFKAQFISGIIMPSMMFIGNLTYVLVAVVGGLRVASGSMSLGDVQAFIQYSRQFTQPLSQLASMANVLQSGVASAERVFELLDETEEEADPADPVPVTATAGRVEFEHVSFSYQEDKPLIHDLSLVAEPGHTIAIVGPTGAGKTTLVNLIMRFYELDAGPDHPGRHRYHPDDPARPARADRHGAAGHLALRRHHPGQHRLRQTGLQRGGDRDRGPGDLRRPVRQVVPGRLRHGDRRGGQQRQRRPAPVDHHRPGVPVRSRAADPRRGHLLGGHPHRGAGPARDGGTAVQPDQLRDRAPAVHHPRRRSDPGDGGRQHRGAGQPRGVAGGPGRVLQPVQRAVRGADR
jgi:ATP-binding cassette subfamily B protein